MHLLKRSHGRKQHGIKLFCAIRSFCRKILVQGRGSDKCDHTFGRKIVVESIGLSSHILRSKKVPKIGNVYSLEREFLVTVWNITALHPLRWRNKMLQAVLILLRFYFNVTPYQPPKRRVGNHCLMVAASWWQGTK